MDVDKALQAGDSKAVERAAHSMKGALGIFSADGAVAAALRLEEMGRGEDLTGAGDAQAHLLVELGKVKESLSTLIAEEAD